jgi:hypothetical protein
MTRSQGAAPIRRITILTLLTLAGCKDLPEHAPASAAAALKGGVPAQRHLITDVPRWTAVGDPDAVGECFGSSVATGDLDGDGEVDLVVAAPNCFWAPRSNGRVAIYRGQGGSFAPTPVYTALTWPHAKPNPNGRGMSVDVRDVDGDGRADLLVASRYGAAVFTGISDLDVPLGAPVFRVPGDDLFGRSFLADVDGDGLADIVSTRLGIDTSVWRSTPGAPTGPFTLARTLDSPAVAPAGDTNGDGADDLLVYTDTGTDLFLGCPIGSPMPCTGGLRRLLRFTTSIQNVGAAPLVIPGPEEAPELYHFDECHGHDHLDQFARYELRDNQGTVVTTGRKQGFFLFDVQPQCIDAGEPADFYPSQGISPGWSDVYIASLPCQWIDITGMPDGHYVLYVGADEQHIVDQDDAQPDFAEVRLKIEGSSVKVLP